jgi:hypothetical protein
MKKHLYRVEAKAVFEFVVYAESEEAAQNLAIEFAEEEFHDLNKGFGCSVIGKRIPKELHHTYAYGSDATGTVGEMLSDGEECSEQQWETN